MASKRSKSTTSSKSNQPPARPGAKDPRTSKAEQKRVKEPSKNTGSSKSTGSKKSGRKSK